MTERFSGVGELGVVGPSRCGLSRHQRANFEAARSGRPQSTHSRAATFTPVGARGRPNGSTCREPMSLPLAVGVTFERFGGCLTGLVFQSPRVADQPQDRGWFDRRLARAERKAGLPKLARSLWHAYHRKWATEWKHDPLKDIAAAGLHVPAASRHRRRSSSRLVAVATVPARRQPRRSTCFACRGAAPVRARSPSRACHPNSPARSPPAARLGHARLPTRTTRRWSWSPRLTRNRCSRDGAEKPR